MPNHKYIGFYSLLIGVILLMGFMNVADIEHKGGHPEHISIPNQDDATDLFLKLAHGEDKKTINTAISYVDKHWQEAYEIMLIETVYFSQNGAISDRLIRLLERKSGKRFGHNLDKWFQWLWNKTPTYSDSYYKFKAKLHQGLDPKFKNYFLGRQAQSTIRLDEVRWGGVRQDGIPPLRQPKMISAKEATYLKDSNIVFGIEVNGDARAYPKRILAWHEMFVDTVGDIPVAGVYCTLCGTVILYKTEHQGINYQLGTSGFLYRSNKLMYDKTTQSLWSTLEGQPVIGPLVGKGIALDYLSVVTTTWGAWKKRHPETTVLSLQTGHLRDYGEGVAYRSYFATDDLMFTIPKIDKSLNNKDEILAIRTSKAPNENLAIASRFLTLNPIYTAQIGRLHFVVLTDRSGAHRVYETQGQKFVEYDGLSEIKDTQGVNWTLSEDKITSSEGKILKRIPAHNAFWFGYKAAFPNTKLIK